MLSSDKQGQTIVCSLFHLQSVMHGGRVHGIVSAGGGEGDKHRQSRYSCFSTSPPMLPMQCMQNDTRKRFHGS